MNHHRVITTISPLAAGLVLSACAAAPPEQVAQPALPDPGRDGTYEVDFPQPTTPVQRLLRMTVSSSVHRQCPADKAHFQFDEARPRPQDAVAMRALAGCLNHSAVRDLDVRVIGHADERGSSAYNLDLARKRAERVKALLVAEGVAPSRLRVESRGERASHGEQGGYTHSFDRRVEVDLVGEPKAPAVSGVKSSLMPAPTVQ